MKPHRRTTSTLLVLWLLAFSSPLAAADGTTDRSPWGIASGAEWSGEFPWFNPLLHDAGVTWLRVGAWGWNFRTDAGGSPGEFQLEEVRMRKARLDR